jgi:hypothetical protein
MATPAEPVLASALWIPDQPSHHDPTEEVSRKPSSGCPSIDKAFGGALQYGRICCISAEANSGGRELCEAYVVSHLLSSQDATATVIDTALSFDVRKFHRTLLSRLEGDPEKDQLAMATLDRLKIMKVFDFEGLTDSIMEVQNNVEALKSETEWAGQRLPAPRGTIGDSEDEDEMLDSPSPSPAMRAELVQRNINTDCNSRQLLLIDSISHVVAPMMRNRYVEGQALLISFMRSLTHLTTTNQLLTILSNDAIPKANIKDESPSIFAACTVRPALGRSFEHVLDTHLLVHRPPNKPTSRQRDHNGLEAELPIEEKTISVVGVLQDRHGGTFGRWAAFTIDDRGVLRDVR